MATTPFVWGPGGQQLSATDVARNRKTAEALMSRIKNPQNMWEGIQSAVGDVGGSLLNWQADDAEEKGRSAVADALMQAQGGSDPNAYISVLGNEFASPAQSAVAQALLQRRWAQADQQADWAHDADVRQDERDYNAPVRDAQLTGYGIENETGKFNLDQAREGYTSLVTPEDRAAQGIEPADTRPWQRGADGKLYDFGSGSGQTINVNTGEGSDSALDKKLSEKEGESWAAVKDAGMVAGAMSQDLGLLDELIKIAPQGPIIGPLAETFKGFSSAGDAFQSVVKRVAPSLRTPGSGATSDIEYQGFLDGLPALKNSPDANRLINVIMKSKAAINKERSDIVTAYQAGQLSIGQARAAMAEVNNRSIITPEMRKALAGVGAAGEVEGPPEGAAPDGIDPAVWAHMTPEGRALWQN